MIFGKLAISVGYTVIVGGDRADTMTKVLFLAMLSKVVAWLFLLDAMAKLPSASGYCLLSWKTDGHIYLRKRGSKKYIGKFRRSCKTMCIGYSGYIRITRKTHLKFVQGIVRGTFRTVLAFK